MGIGRMALRALAAAAVIGCWQAGARAETDTVRIARQYGVGYLPLMVIEHDKLLEKYAAQAGVPNVKVQWLTFAGANVLNDALLSGSLDFAAVGSPSLVTFWAKTAGTPQEVKGVTSLTSAPLLLNTRNPNVKSIKDFTEADRIALPAVKVSIQAITLQIAAAKAFGEAAYAKLDPLTVSRSHPDAMAALLSGAGEIDSHFTWPPYSTRELKDPRVHTVLTSIDALGGPAATTVIIATKRFRDANPKLFKAFYEAMKAAVESIDKDHRHAAEVYTAESKDGSTVDEIMKILADPINKHTIVPEGMMTYARFMHKIGTTKREPASWKDMFFPEAQGLPGS